MADNTTTYKATVEVETKGAENIDLLNKSITTSIGDFENLNEGISKLQDTMGKLDPRSAKFKELKKELNGLQTQLEDSTLASGKFIDALAGTSGITGLVGQSIKGLGQTMKVFAANPIIAAVTLLAGLFVALKESLNRTEEGTAKLNKITEGLSKIMNGLFAVLEPIAMLFADLIGNLLSNQKVMNGLAKTVGVLTGVFTGLYGSLFAIGEFIVNTLINNFKTLIGVAKGAGDVIAGVFTFDWDRIKKGADAAFTAVKDGVKNTVDNVKGMGKDIAKSVSDGFVAGSKSFTEGSKRLTEQEKEAAAKAEEERKKAAEKRAADRKAAAEKAAEEERKIQETAAAILLEATLSNLSDRDRQLKEREMRFQEEMKALKAAGVTDFLLFEQEYKIDQLAINKTFDDEILKQQEEANKKKADAQKLADDEAKKKKEELDKFLVDSEQLKTDSIKYIQDMQVANAGADGNLLGMIACKNKKLAIAGLVLEQGANIAKVVIDTARGISAATAAAAPFMANPFTAIPATANLARVIVQQKISAALSIAGIIAGAAKGISQINQADIPGGGGSAPGGGGGGGGSASVNIPAPTLTAAQAPQIQSGQGVDPSSQISQAIAGAGQKPMRAYVVSQDVSSQQALDRRTNVAATFSG